MKTDKIRKVREDDSFAHHWLCHGDGSECQDGCNKAADPKRLEFYNNLPDEIPYENS